MQIPLLPSPIADGLRWLRERGHQPWLVGGAPRDLLLGRPVADFDVAVAADGFALSRALANVLRAAWVPLDEARGVGRVVLRHHHDWLWLDIARFRDGALEADLLQRDFTVNAIALDPTTGTTVDPSGGLADLEARRLRPTNERAFLDDPLRILRGVRLSATHGLSLDPSCQPLMRQAAPQLREVAGERQREEWLKLLAPAGAAARVERLDDFGVLPHLLPELHATQGVTQSLPHSHDVFGHSLLVLSAIEQLWPWGDDPLWDGPFAPWRAPIEAHLQAELAHGMTRWQLLKHVALLHDIGKAVTRTVGEDGRIHFYQHDRVGAELLDGISRRLRFSNEGQRYSALLVSHHLRPLQLGHHLPVSDKSLYRLFRALRHSALDLALLSLADQRGKAFATDRAEVVAACRAIFAAFFDEPQRYLDVTPLLDGNEIMQRFGWQGRRIGQALEFLREQQAMGKVRSEDEAERALRGWSPKAS